MKTSAAVARLIQRARVAIILSALFALQACSNDRISAAQTVTNGVAAEAFQVHVTGTVTNEDGVPVPGVLLKVYRGTPSSRPVSVVTDATGSYSVAFLSAPNIWVFTVKEGYRSAWQSHEASGGMVFRWDLRIYHS